MRTLPKTNEHSFFGCGRMTHTAFWERGRTKRMLTRTRGLYIIAMVLAAPPSAAHWAFGPSSASDEEESELWASSSEPSTAQRKKTSGQTRSAINITNLYFLCLLCLFANYIYGNNLLWLWIWPALHAACLWSVHIIQQFHSPKRRVDSKTNCSTTLFGTASPFLWDPGYHTTAWVACWRSLAPKRPATNQKKWTLHAIGQLWHHLLFHTLLGSLICSGNSSMMRVLLHAKILVPTKKALKAACCPSGCVETWHLNKLPTSHVKDSNTKPMCF